MNDTSWQSDIDSTWTTFLVKCPKGHLASHEGITETLLTNYTRNDDGTYTSRYGDDDEQCVACYNEAHAAREGGA